MKTDIMGCPKFKLGVIAITPGVDDYIRNGLLVDLYLDRHWRGDWGDVGAEDSQVNEQSLINGSRLLSSYKTALGKVWIITESNRALTTILTPDEY